MEHETVSDAAHNLPLQDAETVAQAQEKLKTLHVDRSRNDLPVLKRTPKFADYAAQYLAYYETVKDAKRPATITVVPDAMRLYGSSGRMWTGKTSSYQLRRIENAILNRDLSWLCALPEKFRVQNSDRPFVSNLSVRVLDQPSSTVERSSS